MNKKELDVLEKAFSCEISGVLFQAKSMVAKKLEEEGYLSFVEETKQDKMGKFKVSYYNLTNLGRITYCESERCK
jgi:hypothetical protein